MTLPLVSVVVTAHNSERFVREAVGSLLGQSYEDLEVIIVNDASTDSTGPLLEAMRGDPRLVVLHSAKNQGPFASAQRALELARGELIARLDSDDVAEPDRIRLQVAFLERHPEVGLLGSACHLISEDGAALGSRVLPPTDREIRWASLFANPFQHSAVMVRRHLLEDEGYDPSVRVGGDWELWSRLLPRTLGANLTEPLVRYRRVSTGITATQRPLQLAMHEKIAWQTLCRQLPRFQGADRALHARLRARLDGRAGPGPDDQLLARTYLEMFEAFAKEGLAAAGEWGRMWEAARDRAARIQRGEP